MSHGTRSPVARTIALFVLLALTTASCDLFEDQTPDKDQKRDREREREQGSTTQELARSVVVVQLMSGGQLVGHGSGTVIDDSGMILTNAHVATPDLLMNVDVTIDEIVIAVSRRPQLPPTPLYTADVVATDPGLDLAVIRPVAGLDGEPYAAGTLPAAEIGNSRRVRLGDEIRVLGYPSLGGDTVTVTEGLVAGFNADEVAGQRAWIKTDATIARGNSGGMAANSRGELIGVPTIAGAGPGLDPVDCRPLEDTNQDGVLDDDDDCTATGGFLNGIRPVELALPMIEAAESGQEYVPVENPNPSEPFDIEDVTFESLRFDSQTPSVAPTTNQPWLPSGTARICAWWRFSGMADGVLYDAVWSQDGEVREDASLIGQIWTYGPEGETWSCVYGEGPVDEGVWQLSLNVTGELIRGGFVSVGDALTPVEISLTNGSSDVQLCKLYVSPTVATVWGEERLGGDPLDPGEAVALDLPPMDYDIWAHDCSDNEVLVQEQAIGSAPEIILQPEAGLDAGE